jgi:hypothetical protein
VGVQVPLVALIIMKNKIRNPFALNAKIKKAGPFKKKYINVDIGDFMSDYTPYVSTENFLLGLEKSASQIKNTIECWYEFDEDLRENYRESIQWNIDNASYFTDSSVLNFNDRLYQALNIYHLYEKELYEIGINVSNSLCLKKENT